MEIVVWALFCRISTFWIVELALFVVWALFENGFLWPFSMVFYYTNYSWFAFSHLAGVHPSFLVNGNSTTQKKPLKDTLGMDKNYTFRTVFDNYYEHKLACKLDPRFSFKIINSSKRQQHTPIFPQYGLLVPSSSWSTIQSVFHLSSRKLTATWAASLRVGVVAS